MGVIVYQKVYNREGVLEDFIDLFYNRQFKHFASDLLNEGFTPEDIRAATKKAISVGESSALDMRKHFSPIYTQSERQMIWDCKLSRLGYALVLLNANPNNPIVGKWQLTVLKKYFEK